MPEYREKRLLAANSGLKTGFGGLAMHIMSYLQKVYRELHAQPELSAQEAQTAAFVAAELKEMGFTVTTGVGGHGVVGVFPLVGSGPTLALRCDMDALPVSEETGADFASQNPGVMHACGHDSHMAMVLGACRYAVANEERLRGTLMAIFQPSEEVGMGARSMLEAGVFSRLTPFRLVGIHNWPDLPAGTLGLQSGPITASTDQFKAVLRGVGGHGARPHQTRDTIAMAAAAVQNAFTLAQRRADPASPQVLSFGAIRGGTSFNIIPEQVVLEGTVRTVRSEDQALMIRLLHQAFKAAADLHGGSYELMYEEGVPAVVNDPAVTAEIAGFFAARIPDIPVVSEGLASLIGEDVGCFLQEVPGILLFIGSGQEGAVNELHNPRFLVPCQTLVTGYKALTSIIAGYLSK